MSLKMLIRYESEKEVPGLGAKIKQIRKDKGIPIAQLCADAGMTTSNWYKIEAEGYKSVPLATIRRMEVALGVDLGIEV